MNVTVCYLCQDMFPQGKYAKTISRNAQYIIAFKNPSDKVALRTLLLQIYPTKWLTVMDIYIMHVRTDPVVICYLTYTLQVEILRDV